MTPTARTAGHALAFTALALAFAAAAQAPITTPDAGGGGVAWLFAVFVAAAVGGIFLFVLWLVRGPTPRAPETPPGAAPDRR
jgi:hypothetical protein